MVKSVHLTLNPRVEGSNTSPTQGVNGYLANAGVIHVIIIA